MKRILVVLALFSMIGVVPAHAQPGDDWPKSEWRKSSQASKTTRAKPRRTYRSKRSAHRHRYRPRYRKQAQKPSWSNITTGSIGQAKVSGDSERRVAGRRECSSAVSVVGDQAATMNGAKAQAEKAWQQQVRFLSGELYSDPRYAENIAYRCVDSSIRNLANRATEIVGINSQLKRCSMTATPCRATSVLETSQ